MKRILSNINIKVVLIIIFVALVYGQLPQQFFQQDEWHHLGQELIWHKKGIINFFLEDAVSPVGIRFLPFGYLLNYLQYSLFGSNPAGYSLVSLFFHLLNTVLIYVIIKKLINKERVVLLSALLFGIWFSHQQAVTWLIQHSTTLPALTFSLIAIYYFQKSKMLGTFLSILTAIFFKETAFYIFPFLIFLPLVEKLIHKKVKFSKLTLLVIFTGIVYAATLMIFYFSQPKEKTELFIPQQGTKQVLIRRMFSIPLRIIPQSIFGEKNILKVSKQIAGFTFLNILIPEEGTSGYDIFIEQSLSKKIMYIISFIFIFVVLIFLIKTWKKHDRLHIKKGILVSLMFIFLGSFPLLFISTLAGNFAFLESRYLYIVDIGVVLLIALLCDQLLTKSKVIGVTLLTLFIALNSYSIFFELSTMIEEGRLRKEILAAILVHKPKLPQKALFYIESDRSYYGLPEEIRTLPFQSGIGQMLLVKYFSSEEYSIDFFSNDFLWNIDSQDYKEYQGRGFGFYRDDKALFYSMLENNIGQDSIIAFSFDSSINALTDISDEIMGRYLGYISDKSRVSRLHKIDTFFNKPDIRYAIDGNRNSFWSSGVPYSIPQLIDVDLGLRRKVAGIKIDSNGDLEQNKVGYMIETSIDGFKWKTVFNSKLYPPGKDGINDLYFRPEYVRYIRIRQVGYHKFASWVINELSIYETK